MASLLKAFGGRWKRPLQSVTYNAILFKRFTITSSTARPDSALINYVWQNVFAKEDMIVDSEALRVANREGLDWMQRMERETQAQRNIINQLREDSKIQKMINEKLENKIHGQENKMHHQENRIHGQENKIHHQENKIRGQENKIQGQEITITQLEADFKAQKIINNQTKDRLEAQETINSQTEDELKAQKRIWCSIRAAEIERNADCGTEEAMLARSERNEVVYGGNIVGDLRVLEFLKTEMPERYDSIREAFEVWYETSFQYKDRIVHAPERVIEAFDTLASTKPLFKWSKNRKSQEEAQKICRGMISRWLEYIDAADGQYPGNDIRREFEKLVRLKSALGITFL